MGEIGIDEMSPLCGLGDCTIVLGLADGKITVTGQCTNAAVG
jgi:hypothetical protein